MIDNQSSERTQLHHHSRLQRRRPILFPSISLQVALEVSHLQASANVMFALNLTGLHAPVFFFATHEFQFLVLRINGCCQNWYNSWIKLEMAVQFSLTLRIFSLLIGHHFQLQDDSITAHSQPSRSEKQMF